MTPGKPRSAAPRAHGTRQQLVEATLAVITEHGIAGASARTIAATAGVNQALIFYHFDTVAGLIDAAYDVSVAAAVERYVTALTPARTLVDLVGITRGLRAQEPARTEVLLMAQLLAAAQHDPALAGTAQRALARWSSALKPMVKASLARTGLETILDPVAVTDFVISGFIGLELVETVDQERGQQTRVVLADMVNLLSAIETLPAPARRTVIGYLKRTRS